MAKLYEIIAEIENCINLETGEIEDFEKFEQLQIDKSAKIENIALWHKNLISDAEQYKAEKMAFAVKQKQAENKAESLKNYLDLILQGETFKTVKVNCTYRKSKSVEVSDVSKIPSDYLKFAEPTADKTAIKKAIESGEVIDGAELVEKANIQIK